MGKFPKLRENDETWHKVGVGKDGTLASTGLFEEEQLRRSPLRLIKILMRREGLATVGNETLGAVWVGMDARFEAKRDTEGKTRWH